MCNRQIGGICHSVYLGYLQTHDLQHKHNKGRSKVLNALKQNMPSLLANQIPTRLSALPSSLIPPIFGSAV